MWLSYSKLLLFMKNYFREQLTRILLSNRHVYIVRIYCYALIYLLLFILILNFNVMINVDHYCDRASVYFASIRMSQEKNKAISKVAPSFQQLRSNFYPSLFILFFTFFPLFTFFFRNIFIIFTIFRNFYFYKKYSLIDHNIL